MKLEQQCELVWCRSELAERPYFRVKLIASNGRDRLLFAQAV